MRFINVVCVIFLFFSNSTYATDLNGWQGEFAINFPTVNDTIGGPATFTVGSGIEGNINAGNIDFTLDIATNQILLGFNDSNCCTSNAVFAGPVITFNNVLESLTSVTLIGTNILNFNASNISFNGNQIFINIANGYDLSNNRNVQLLISTSPVPENTVFSMMLFGTAIFLTVLRRKRKET